MFDKKIYGLHDLFGTIHEFILFRIDEPLITYFSHNF